MKQTRPLEIQNFLDAISAVFTARTLPCPSSINTAKKIIAALEVVDTKNSASAIVEIPTLIFLDKAITMAEECVSPISDLARTLATLAPQLPWYCRQAPEFNDFMNGHANAEIVGPRGLEVRSDISVGVTLLAPGIQYPDHNHKPDEIYIILSNGEWRQEDQPWHSLRCGGYVFNPSYITHAIRAGEQPLLAVWCLWGYRD